MAYYKVKQGDCLSSIAKDFGFASGQTIYDHPDNAEYRDKRPNPNCIYPGDKLFIPERETKKIEESTEQTHKNVVKKEKTWLNIKLEHGPDEPISGTYKLIVDGKEFKGTLDSDGWLKQEIAPDSKVGMLRVKIKGLPPEDAIWWELKIGELDPIEELSGVQGRLWNIGIDCGPVDNIDGPQTQAGVRSFQRLVFDDPDEWDGVAGPKTKEKLREHHVS